MITATEYGGLQMAFEHFNQALFSGSLPQCMITLSHGKRCLGFHHKDRFRERGGKNVVDEISLNVDLFEERNDREIMETLVHEMCHLWQAAHGTPSRFGYHNKEWFAKMHEIGIEPEGKGQRVTTGKETPGGLFRKALDELLNTKNYRLKWEAFVMLRSATTKRDKVKYSCDECNSNAWGKPGLYLICGDCDRRMEGSV